jgi:dipeptidyl aminopeptidase/acylaminoacyl peptidase
MVYGEKDSRVPPIHGEDMRDALKKYGKVHEWTLLEKEEHGLASEENRFAIYGAIEKFLKKYNPPN